MKVFVWVEFLPTLAGIAFGLNLLRYGDGYGTALSILIGLVVQGVLMLYRIITGIVAFFDTFQKVPALMESINHILGRVLGAPGSRNLDTSLPPPTHRVV